MMFPSEISGKHNQTQSAKRRWTENERAQIKKWCKLARGVKAKRRKTSGIQLRNINMTCSLVHELRRRDSMELSSYSS